MVQNHSSIELQQTVALTQNVKILEDLESGELDREDAAELAEFVYECVVDIRSLPRIQYDDHSLRLRQSPVLPAGLSPARSVVRSLRMEHDPVAGRSRDDGSKGRTGSCCWRRRVCR